MALYTGVLQGGAIEHEPSAGVNANGGVAPRRGASRGAGETAQRHLHPHRRPPLRRDGLPEASLPGDAATSTAWRARARTSRTRSSPPRSARPSRATILTGLYAHRHRIVDNNTAIPPGTSSFPQYLQKAGYKTGFFGKWHMGERPTTAAAGLRPLGQLPRTGHLPAAPKTASTSTARRCRRRATSPTS